MKSPGELKNLCRTWEIHADSKGHCFGTDPEIGPFISGYDRQTDCEYFEYSVVKDRCKFFFGFRVCTCPRAKENYIIAKKIEKL